MQRQEFYWVSDSRWAGQVGIVPRPRGGDWLDDDVRAWRAAGVDIAVSLLTPEEVEEFELDAEASLADKHGMLFRWFPIPDLGIPSSVEAAVELVADLAESVQTGKRVVVHCRQGIGRSGLLVASVLAMLGEDPEQAFAAVARARGRPVPETAEQRDWLRALASQCSAREVKL